jgi:hypothetical protein
VGGVALAVAVGVFFVGDADGLDVADAESPAGPAGTHPATHVTTTRAVASTGKRRGTLSTVVILDSGTDVTLRPKKAN